MTNKIDWTKYPKYDWDNLPDPGKMLKPVKNNISIMKVGISSWSLYILTMFIFD